MTTLGYVMANPVRKMQFYAHTGDPVFVWSDIEVLTRDIVDDVCIVTQIMSIAVQKRNHLP